MCKVSVKAIVGEDTMEVNGRMILYFPKESGLRIGDNVLLNKFPDSIINNGNPGEFNYARFLALKQVYHSAFIRHGEYLKVYNDAGPLEKAVSVSRDAVLSIIKNNIRGGSEVTGLAQALLIGYRGELDKALLQDYSATGVVHIIAVSGLHLGLIYAVFHYLLQLICRKKFVSSRAFFIIVFLWFFSLLTGCSASVLRAAVMFSLLIIGKTWFRQTSVYNTLSASAVLLLIYDPNFLWDAGFQLSYLAVAGIIWLQPFIFRSYYPTSLFARRIWEMSSVTLSAQVATLPICLYYFHQFPLMFLLANLVAVPLSTVILFAGIILIGFSWWGDAMVAVGWITGKMIVLMNAIVSWFASIPFSIIEGLFIDEAGLLSIFLVIVGVAMTFIYRLKPGIGIILAFLLLLSLSICRRRIEIINRNELLVYKSPGKAIELVTGRKSLFIGDTIPASPLFRNARQYLGVTETSILETDLIAPGNLSIVIMDGDRIHQLTSKVKIDILIITGNPLPDKTFLEKYRPRIVVMDGTNRLWKIAKWKTLCDQLLLRFHSVPTQGAFNYSLNHG